VTDKTAEHHTHEEFATETCAGCIAFNRASQKCESDGEEASQYKIVCCDFDGSMATLQCRAVRAAEEANILKRREVEAMEGLLEIARRGFPTLLIRQDGSYVDGDKGGGICDDCLFPTDLCPINEVTFSRDSPIETCAKYDNGSDD
jgi:hypothetical protein